METFHCSMAKHQQNLPKQTSNPGSIATVGWKNVRSHCNFLRLLLLWQLLLLPFECIYKKICVKRLCLLFYTDMSRQGPLHDIYNICKEYGISNIVKRSLESGDYMSKYVWKSIVKKHISSLENKRWQTLCYMYKSLHFLSKERYQMCTWWHHAYHDHSFSKKNRTIIRLLLNVSISMEKMCICCDLHTVNDVVHILFVCPCNSQIR